MTSTGEEVLTKAECFRILELYQGWNMGQKSASFAMTGVRTEEDDMLDERRKLVRAAMKRLTALAGKGA